ncbi:cbb3-type cytochrome c oxidase N-terminal domain-containing protein [Hydrotalea sp.]|uniref:cbb3-type cytochrome c oxidase N-terminal domain-containing protein n=1 Tax=Hydrotalea sp. TaxID=2881279 RepID=UPI00258BE48D|nr:cbb3-type cytochrome c oxidase N-terminal domain-containing protein [Hydrotalea sp.]
METNMQISQTHFLQHQKPYRIWKLIQIIFWIIGLAIFFALVFFPKTGVLIFWNILIPIAPALLVFATGLWRNVCPLSTTVLLPRYFNLSKRNRMSVQWQTRLQFVSILLLFIIVPLRHPIFNNNGHATAILLMMLIAIGITMGFFFEWKSAWCSTICPIHSVEKLYGEKQWLTLPNAHCTACANCSLPCPDSTPDFHPGKAHKSLLQKINALLIIGGLPGFIWGWFQVPDIQSPIPHFNALSTYGLPWIGATASIILFLFLVSFLDKKSTEILIQMYAAAGVSIYYWYRIPELFGFSKFSNDGLLISLKNSLPQWVVTLFVITIIAIFIWWLVFKKPTKKSWLIRPAFVNRNNQSIQH